MRGMIAKTLFLVMVLGLWCALAAADSIPVGYISFDVTTTGVTAQFDIVNQTGPNSSTFPDTTFPITNSISLTSLSLTDTYTNSTTQTFGSGFFTIEPDGISFSGPTIPLGGSNPVAASAVLTGSFSTTTFVLNSGKTVTVGPTFSVLLTDSSGSLQDQDVAFIYGQAKGATTPEPASWIMLGTGCVALLRTRRIRLWR